MNKILNILSIYNFIIILCLFMVVTANRSFSLNISPILLFVPIEIYFLVKILKKIPLIKNRLLNHKIKVLRKPLALYYFVFTNLLFFMLIKNISNITEFIFVLFLIPLELYFILLVVSKFPIRKSKKENIITAFEESVEDLDEVEKIEEIKEKDRRKFLKIMAGAGLGVLLTGIVNPQKAGAAFFGSVPGPGTISIKDTTGTKIDPSIKSPTDGYGVANIDTESLPYYYGFVNKDSAWYVVKEVGDGSFLYAKGNDDYDWDNRASETYASYDDTF